MNYVTDIAPAVSNPRRRLRVVRVLASLLVLAYLAGDGPAAAGPAPNAQPAPSHGEPAVSAKAAIVVDITTGIELSALNADQPLPPASTVKIVTALVARSVLNLDDRTTVADNEVLDAEEYSVMGLLPGDDVAVRDLLYGLLVPSGGDAALVLARLGGAALDPKSNDPVGRFVEEMNAWATTHGLNASHFMNPTGADADGQSMSARDLVRATEALMQDWQLTAIVRTQQINVSVLGPNARELQLVNTNQLLGRDDVFGVKTGTENLAGQCLVAGYWRGDDQVIEVVLGSEDRYADAQAIMDDVDGRYRWMALGIGTESLGASQAIADLGLTFRVRRTVLMTQEQAANVVWDFTAEDPPGIGGRAGYVRFLVGDSQFALLPVYSSTTPE